MTGVGRLVVITHRPTSRLGFEKTDKRYVECERAWSGAQLGNLQPSTLLCRDSRQRAPFSHPQQFLKQALRGNTLAGALVELIAQPLK